MLCAPNRPPALHSAAKSAGGGKTASGIRRLLVAHVPDPVALRPVLAVGRRRLLGLDQQVARRDRQQRMGEAVAERLPRPVRHQLRMRLVGDVEDDQAAVDPADIDAVRPLRRERGRVHADAGVERRDARRRRFLVADARARQPPAPGLLRMRRIVQIDDHQELVIVLVVRREVLRAGRQIGVLAIGEPQIVHAARMRARGVEIRQLLRMRRIG